MDSVEEHVPIYILFHEDINQSYMLVDDGCRFTTAIIDQTNWGASCLECLRNYIFGFLTHDTESDVPGYKHLYRINDSPRLSLANEAHQ
jgi:hypothetical protein